MLSEPLTLEPTIKLVPYSGVQFVEYAFNIDKAGRLSRRFIERELDPSLWTEGKRTLKLLPAWDELDPTSGIEESAETEDREYSISERSAIEIFLEKWVPIPMLRVKASVDGGEELDVGPDVPGATSTPIQRGDAGRPSSSAPPPISPSAPATAGPMDLASRIEAGVVLVVADEFVGSGFFVSSELIVTNQHVTAGASDVLVASKKVGILRAKVIGRGVEDETRDFSLLRVAPQEDAIPFEFAVPAAPLSPVIAAGSATSLPP